MSTTKERAMKKVLVAITLLVVLFSASQAFAVPAYTAMNTTISNSDPTEQASFTLDEKPWLSLVLPKTGPSDTLSYWTDPFGASYSLVLNQTASQNYAYLSFSDAFWNGIKQVGNWTISSTTAVKPAGQLSPSTYGGSCNFQVTAVPEPISAGLFLLGGVGLALIRRRK
jgi:hypothetical protein